MPYATIREIPSYVKKYRLTIQRQWMYVFNNVFSKTKDEKRAFKAANSVLKKRMEKHGAYGINTHADWFSFCQDLFLKRL